jgi:uncharacterized membrane-anchored protein
MLPWTLTRTDTEYNPQFLEAGLGTYYVPAGQCYDITRARLSFGTAGSRG